ncbi:hypothetical protein [Streptomyces regalis]|uniref:Cupin n=1 Tax=Streptomyces regalis TaxID=68262 RepID=A0A0X3VDT6_9ACTN|nr:hypothetical protein [Streptomyces regalis]KUL42774.1 hypothetical protein ADL12_08990 [Streptomyces regalis]
MAVQNSVSRTTPTDSNGARHPFHVTKEEERQLRIQADRLTPALVIAQPSSFDEYVQQLMVPPAIMDLARKAANIRLAAWEVEAMRKHLEPGPLTADEPGTKLGLLRRILLDKADKDRTHPPYIRVACTGTGVYDDWATKYGYTRDLGVEPGDYGSPVVLEIWPAQHYSPIHSHGHTTGIVYCLAGQLDVMAYGELAWDARKQGLVTLTPGQCAWLSGDKFAVHKVYCPMDGDNGPTGPEYLNATSEFAASFHVYLNEDELSMDSLAAADLGRDVFEYIDEITHKKEEFKTYSDLSWNVLRRVLAETELD